jgi:CRP-like cAMP-binding protein
MRKVLYVLGQLDDLDVQFLARIGRRRSVADAEAIIRQGVRTDSVFILLDGILSVEVAGRGQVASLRQGEILGEMSFVDSAPPSATVTSQGGATVLQVPKSALSRRIEEDPGFGLRFYRALALLLADRLRAAQQVAPAGAAEAGLVAEDELDELLLDKVSIAGDRFDRLLRTLADAGRQA